MPEMIPNDMSPAWPLAFDWIHAGPEARDAAQLSVALSGVLQRRLGMREQVRPTEESRQFGRYIRALREARQWSRAQLAEHANLHPLAVVLLESAALTEAELSAALVSRIAMAFGKTIRELDINPLAVVPPAPDAEPFGPRLAQHLARLAGYAQVAMPANFQAVAERRAVYQSDTVPQTPERSPEESGYLVHSLRLPAQHIVLPDGRTATGILSLDPAETEGSPLLLRVQVLDKQEKPLEGIWLAADLDGYPFQAEQPTDDQGEAVMLLTLHQLLTAETFRVIVSPSG